MREITQNIILTLSIVNLFWAAAQPQNLQLQRNRLFDDDSVQNGVLGRGLKQAQNRSNFEDIYGNFEFESIVLGSDERVKVNDTQVFPFTAVVQITNSCPSNLPGQRGICSGTMISPRTVLTAGHCVYERVKAEGYCSDFIVTPGRNGNLEPFGTAGVVRIAAPDNWINGPKPDFLQSDYGLLILDQDIGLKTGWIGISVDCVKTTYDDMVVAGFPGDVVNGYNGSTMVFSSCAGQLNACEGGESDGSFQHSCDTGGGQSGAPMWVLNSQNQRVVRAVHTSGTSDLVNNPLNTAVYISVDAYYWIQENMA